MTDIYGSYLSTEDAHGSKVSDKGALQVMLDLKFVYDILSGGDSSMDEESSRSPKPKYSFRQKDQRQKKSAIRTRIDGLVHRLSQRLDPIDWLT